MHIIRMWRPRAVTLIFFWIAIMGLCGLCLKVLEAVLTEATEEPQQQQQQPTSSDDQQCDASSPSYSSLPKGAQKFKVRNVYDGDTLTLVDERRVRLLGVDTPELKQKQPFAQDAKDYTKSRCDNKYIWLIIDGEDHYQRLLGHVFVESGGSYLCINEGLIHEGFATVYSPKKDEKTFNWDKLLSLQTQARKSKRGVWKSFKDELVYKTKYGSAYHKKNCEHLSRSKNLETIQISAALDSGLHPCRTCMS